jgi:hypothetical protein
VSCIAPHLSRAIKGTIEVGALRGSLLSSPVLQNFVLRDVQGDMVGGIEEVRLTHNLTSSVRRRLMGHAIEIVRPQFRIAQEPDGIFNTSKLLSSPRADVKGLTPKRAYTLASHWRSSVCATGLERSER